MVRRVVVKIRVICERFVSVIKGVVVVINLVFLVLMRLFVFRFILMSSVIMR